VAVILNKRPSMGPAIISPKTGRPLVEDVLGANIYRKLMHMLSKDARLSPEMKHEVMVRVLRRRDEIDNGSRTLADVAAYEANNLLNENPN
jgi:hypothetical protein